VLFRSGEAGLEKGSQRRPASEVFKILSDREPSDDLPSRPDFLGLPSRN